MTGIAIIGVGYVGEGMRKLFPAAMPIDPARGYPGSCADTCGKALAIVCVPTPMREDGSCDTSIVEQLVPQIEADLIWIRSTVSPGTCDALAQATGKRIVFSPEYMGEGGYWQPPHFPDPKSPIGHGFMILGGEDQDCGQLVDYLLPVLGPATRFRFMQRLEAEIVKYAENAFLGLKVTFANELRRICESSGANYHRVREGWLDDPRVGVSHSAAWGHQRGYDGKCLPKDIAALAHYCARLGIPSHLLSAMIQANGAALR
jgi:UDPglucose 6-dehydrogenase